MIGNGSVSGFVSVLPEKFQMDAYSEIAIQVEGAKEKTAFTAEYKKPVNDVKERMEAIRLEREEIRRDALLKQMDQKQAELLAQVPPEAMAVAVPQIQQQIDQQKNSLEQGKWYVNDREDLTEYSGYGENADRMRAIGQVFPVLFFLVAALISLDFHDAYGRGTKNPDRNSQSAWILPIFHCRKISGICILGNRRRLHLRGSGRRKTSAIYYCYSVWDHVSAYAQCRNSISSILWNSGFCDSLAVYHGSNIVFLL